MSIHRKDGLAEDDIALNVDSTTPHQLKEIIAFEIDGHHYAAVRIEDMNGFHWFFICQYGITIADNYLFVNSQPAGQPLRYRTNPSAFSRWLRLPWHDPSGTEYRHG